MKYFLLSLAMVLCCTGVLAQEWGEWINVGHQVQVSFKFSRKGCDGTSAARLRNISEGTTFCNVTVTFSKGCNGSDAGQATVSANKLRPGEISESPGNWYNLDKANDIQLTQLTDVECKDLLASKHSGSNEPGTSQNNGTGEVTYKKLVEDAKKRAEENEKKRQKIQEEVEYKLELQRQKQRDQEQQRQLENAAKTSTYTYPNTPEGRLQARFDAEAKKRAQNAQFLSNALPALAQQTYGIVKQIQQNKEDRQKRAEAYYEETNADLNKFIAEDDRYFQSRVKDGQDRQREFVTDESRRKYFLYRVYSDYYFENSSNDGDFSVLRNTLSLFMADTANATMTPPELVKFLNMFTWKNGKLLDYFTSNDFRQFVEIKKGKKYSAETINRLQKLKVDADIMAAKQFGGFFETALSGGNKTGILSILLYKKIKYNEDVFFQLNPAMQGVLPMIPEGKPLTELSFEVHKEAKKTDIFPVKKGTVSVRFGKMNSVHIINLNPSFIFTFGDQLDNNIELAQLASDQKSEGQIWDILARAPNKARAYPNNNDYSTTVLMYNTEVTYLSSFGKTVTINARIYFMLAHNYIRGDKNNPDTDLCLGYLVDLSDNPESEGYESIKSVVNQPQTSTEKYKYVWHVLRNYIRNNFPYEPRFSNMNGLSMLLITDVKPPANTYCGIDLKELLMYYPFETRSMKNRNYW